MKNSHTNSRPRSRAQTRSNTFLYTVCIATIIFVTIFYFYTKEESVNAYSNGQESIATIAENPIVEEDLISKEPTDLNLQPQVTNVITDSSTAVAIIVETDSSLSINPSAENSMTAHLLEEVNSYSEETGENTANHFIQHLNDFYDHLDQQTYMKDFNLYRSSKVHFSNLLQNLLDAPPVVTNETNDLFTILKNTAHFFRILGKENIIILKGILDREKASFEDILKTFYTLTDYPETLKKEYGMTLSQDALYDYAGFFLNTMGGRLYLFRRDSASRMTVSFYAIQIIDKAIKDGNNRHGIDLLPAIDFLINEMENTGKQLLLKEEYLDTLYDQKESYN